ncbi:ATP-binding protein [Flavobacterium sp.]|uniref:sensor histidine kinase n=1 Tax=Flavobacterium sp. TaxID=239 RepID=UPI002612A334|nr:ATP-binding protein [Flavobacterium sp.]
MKQTNSVKQLVSGGLILMLVCLPCFIFRDVLGHRVVALLLLMTVSIMAMTFEIIPILVLAALSALVWNFFFIPPLFTFHISSPEDILLFTMYFIIAMVNVVFMRRIRRMEQKNQEQAQKERTLILYSTFFNSLSHELRTPIATIIGSAETLQSFKTKLAEKEESELLQQIESAGHQLHLQVNNILNVSRLESGLLAPKMEWCDVNDIIQSALQNHFPNQNRIEFHVNEHLPLCQTDAGLWEQIILNVLKNALLYTSGAVWIDVWVENNQLTLTITDEGSGIPEEHLTSVFEKFYRLSHTQTGGTGLGLSIVKGYIEVLQGAVKAENRKVPSRGLQVTLQIPVATNYVNQLKNE